MPLLIRDAADIFKSPKEGMFGLGTRLKEIPSDALMSEKLGCLYGYWLLGTLLLTFVFLHVLWDVLVLATYCTFVEAVP